MRRIGRVIALVVAGLAMAVATGWSALVLFYLAPGPSWMRSALAWSVVALGLVALGALAVRRVRWPMAIGLAVAVALVLVVWGSARPSNDRDWPPEVAVLPHATIDGARVTVHNIRNFDYRTETEFTPAYYDRTFDLQRLDRVDLVAVYWMGPAIAHLFLTFGFGDAHLAISIEVRRSARSRTGRSPASSGSMSWSTSSPTSGTSSGCDQLPAVASGRGLPVPADWPIENGRRSSSTTCATSTVARAPRFYNTLTTNCTTMILAHTAVNPGSSLTRGRSC